ncbi:hypothetical protein C8Q76DRAFT_723006 [Earliella scabrosa]|nr:hypothetical protein C8Q76DRAFT_723006 [Earliella scabrosa]
MRFLNASTTPVPVGMAACVLGGGCMRGYGDGAEEEREAVADAGRGQSDLKARRERLLHGVICIGCHYVIALAHSARQSLRRARRMRLYLSCSTRPTPPAFSWPSAPSTHPWPPRSLPVTTPSIPMTTGSETSQRLRCLPARVLYLPPIAAVPSRLVPEGDPKRPVRDRRSFVAILVAARSFAPST